MIVSKTPLRLTLGGGGTDLPSYSSNYGGFVVTSAINKYIYLVINQRFEEPIRASYSITEIVSPITNIKHPVIREALQMLQLKSNLEIISIAELPAETGLGSSSSFTVGLLHALHMYKDEHLTRQMLAEEACRLQMEILKEPCGFQDTFIATFGGFICLDIKPSGQVVVSPLSIPDEAIRELENNLVFFYTGIKRSSSTVLCEQGFAVKKDGSKELEAMHQIKEIGFKVKKSLEKGDITEFGRLQHEHWLVKKQTSNTISNNAIDKWYTRGLENGALGGKLMGAGGGGFLMFYCENGRDKLRKAMAKEGLREVAFCFEPDGSKISLHL
ncbi:MAG: galactokinase [Candidatus Bathyarchaeota archaeon]|nr:galactokinase [Candidatus Bathyarchaeota archaeon]